MLRLAGPASACALFALAAVTFAHPSATRLFTWPWTLAALLLWLVPLFLLFLAALRFSEWRPPSPLVLGGAILLAAVTLASAIASPFAAASLPHVWPTLSGVALLLGLHAALAAPRTLDERAAVVTTALAWLGGALTLASFALWWRGHWPLPWGSRNATPFGHSTYTAGAMVLVLPWLAFAARRRRGLARWAWLATAAVALLVLASTGSRGGVIAVTAVSAVATVGLLLFAPWPRGRKLLLAAAFLAIAGLIVASNARLRELVLHRRWSEHAATSNLQRRAMLEAGMHLGQDRLALGWGPGAVPLAYPLVRARLDGGVENVLQLHSSPLQLWATTGLAGAAAATLLLAGLLRAALQGRARPVTLTAGAALAGFGVFALTDHALDLPFFTVFVAANAALMSAGARPTAPWVVASLTRRFVSASIVALVAAALPATVRELRARFHYQAALDELAAGRTEAAQAALQRASAAAPHDPYFAHRQAALLLDARAQTPDPARQLALTRAAVAQLEAALATAAHQEFAHFNLGWLLLDLGQPAAAARHFISAARFVPDKGGVYLGLGLALLASDRPADAVRAFALEWLNDPRSATSPAWETPLLAPHASAIHAEARRLLAPLRAQSPAAAVIESWIHWGRGNPPPADLRPHNSASRAFVAALPRIEARAPLDAATAVFAWAQAYAAWREPIAPAAAAPDASSRAPGFARCTDDPRFAAALARHARAWPDDFRAFLTAPAGDDADLVVTFQRERSGYGVLARHPAGPPLTDAYIVQENRVTAAFAAELFPRKGTLPGRFLLALLPDAPR